MVAAIGLMIGFYIVTRMTSFLSRKGDREESRATKILAAITIIVTLFMMLDLIFAGTSRTGL